MKLTKWFSGYQLPIRKGVYQRRDKYKDIAGYSYWNGFQWYLTANNPIDANYYFVNDEVSFHQNWDWRGVAK